MSSPDTPASRVSVPRGARASQTAGGTRGSRAGEATQRMPAVGPAPARVQPAARRGAATRVQPAPRTTSAATPPAAPAADPAADGAGTRHARLVLSRVDPWSVMKLAFLLSIALAIVSVVAVAVVWHVLEDMGVYDAVGRPVAEVSDVQIMDYIGLGRVLGLTTIIAAANVVLLTALSTLGAFLYNLAASLVGGLHVTLAEEV